MGGETSVSSAPQATTRLAWECGAALSGHQVLNLTREQLRAWRAGAGTLF